MELYQNEQKTIRFSQNNKYIKDDKKFYPTLQFYDEMRQQCKICSNQSKQKNIQVKEQYNNNNKPTNAIKEEQRQYMSKSELVQILMKKINENYEFCYKLLRQSQWNIDEAIKQNKKIKENTKINLSQQSMQSSLIMYSQSQSLDENLQQLSPLNKQLSQQQRDKDIQNKKSNNGDSIKIKEKNQDKIYNSLEKLQYEGQNINDLSDKNEKNQNKQKKQGVDDTDMKKIIQENDKIIQNSEFNENINIKNNNNELIDLLVAICECSKQEAQNALKLNKDNFELAERHIRENLNKKNKDIINDQEEKQQKNKHNNNNKSKNKDKVVDYNLIKDLVGKYNCQDDKALNILKAADWDYELACNLYEFDQNLNQNQHQNQKKQENNDNKFNNEIENNDNIQDDSQQLTNEQLLMTLVKCQKYVAREALKIFSNDLKTAENFLKQAIEFCRGDEEQAIRLISVDILELGALNSLTYCQRQALNHIARQAQQASQRAIPKLRERFEKLKFSDLDLDQTLKYIRDEAPIIIHVNLQKVLKFFTEDTHYRNQFETKTSGGTLDQNRRIVWEDRLFGNHYNKAKPVERPKYGVLNILKSQEGVASCQHYGRSYLVLKEVRLRTTFAGQDSGQLAEGYGAGIIGGAFGGAFGGEKKSIEDSIATCQHYAHVLNTFQDQELIDVVEVAIGKFPYGKQNSLVFGQYKEIQIHGEVKFDKHVQYLYYEPQELIPVGQNNQIFGYPLRYPHKKVKKQKIKKVQSFESFESFEKEDKQFQADSPKEQLELFRILYPNIEIIEIQKG